MPAQLKVTDLVVGNRYNVFFLETPIRKMQGVKFDVPVSTGTLQEKEDGDAVIEKDEKDKNGNPIIGYFGDNSYRFEEVPSATANKVVDPVPMPAVETYAAGTGFRAARALRKTRGARRKTRKHTRRSRKTRRYR
jgi:hypothetical protein